MRVDEGARKTARQWKIIEKARARVCKYPPGACPERIIVKNTQQDKKRTRNGHVSTCLTHARAESGFNKIVERYVLVHTSDVDLCRNSARRIRSRVHTTDERVYVYMCARALKRDDDEKTINGRCERGHGRICNSHLHHSPTTDFF